MLEFGLGIITGIGIAYFVMVFMHEPEDLSYPRTVDEKLELIKERNTLYAEVLKWKPVRGPRGRFVKK